MEDGGEEKEKRGRKLRERSSTFSLSFLAIGPVVKKKSASPCKEFQVETRNREFRQTSRGRSSPTFVIFYLKGRVVVSCPKGNVWLHFLTMGSYPSLIYALAGL